MQNELPYEYSLESISSPTLFCSSYISSSVDAAGGMYVAPHMARCPGNIPVAYSPTKRHSPESVLPLDAPTQPRRYVTPSITSRKDVPSFYTQKKRRTSLPSEGEEDELEEERIGIPNNDQQEIEKRRRKNTIAARKSRMKKLEHKIALEQAVERLTTEKEIWKTRALTLRSILHKHGIPCPDFDDWSSSIMTVFELDPSSIIHLSGSISFIHTHCVFCNRFVEAHDDICASEYSVLLLSGSYMLTLLACSFLQQCSGSHTKDLLP